MRKWVELIVFVLSVVTTLLGVYYLIFACHGECGASNHGGLLHYMCFRLYVPISISIILIVLGLIGAAVSAVFYRARIKEIRRSVNAEY